MVGSSTRPDTFIINYDNVNNNDININNDNIDKNDNNNNINANRNNDSKSGIFDVHAETSVIDRLN